MERERPLRVALLGEFNAGKSTLLNALLGADVAPTGVTPTTATLHWVAWAPDPFARIVVRGGSDRVVPHAELKRTLAELRRGAPRRARAHLRADRAARRIELLDTPGFNASAERHGHGAFRRRRGPPGALAARRHDSAQGHRAAGCSSRSLHAGVPIQFLVNK